MYHQSLFCVLFIQFIKLFKRVLIDSCEAGNRDITSFVFCSFLCNFQRGIVFIVVVRPTFPCCPWLTQPNNTTILKLNNIKNCYIATNYGVICTLSRF